MNVNNFAGTGRAHASNITFDISEAAEAMIAAQTVFGDRCAIVGLGDDYFKIVQEEDGVNADTKDIADIGSWWNNEWNEVTE